MFNFVSNFTAPRDYSSQGGKWQDFLSGFLGIFLIYFLFYFVVYWLIGGLLYYAIGQDVNLIFNAVWFPQGGTLPQDYYSMPFSIWPSFLFFSLSIVGSYFFKNRKWIAYGLRAASVVWILHFFYGFLSITMR